MQVAAPLDLAEAAVVAVEEVAVVAAVVEISIAVVLVEGKLVAWTLFAVLRHTAVGLAVGEVVVEGVNRNSDIVGHLAGERLAEDLAFGGLAACAAVGHADAVACLDHCEDCI